VSHQSDSEFPLACLGFGPINLARQSQELKLKALISVIVLIVFVSGVLFYNKKSTDKLDTPTLTLRMFRGKPK